VLQSFEDENMKLKLDGLIPPLFTVVSQRLHSGDEMEVRDILMDLLDIAESEPRMFKRNCREHVSLLLAVMSGRDPSNPSLALDSETRQSAMELVVTLVENRPGLVRKDEQQMRAICESLMALLLEIEDVPRWHTAIEEEDLDEGTNSQSTLSGEVVSF
jgi:importin-5